MSLDVDLLRASFNLVIERQPDVTRRFYEVLFERYPQARELFGRNTRAQQEKMLAEALVAVMDHLEDGPWLEQTLTALGARHVDYGVTAEMYDWVGASLLATLAEVADDAWSSELEAAWTAAYAAIASLMQAGGRQTAA